MDRDEAGCIIRLNMLPKLLDTNLKPPWLAALPADSGTPSGKLPADPCPEYVRVV